jgi:hypothetical protein
MSLLRIPFALSTIWAVSVAMTPPQRPPDKDERVRTNDFDATVIPPVIKASLPFSLYTNDLDEGPV